MSNPWDAYFARLGAPMGDIIDQFESLGENCEFGFLQAANNSPSSSLLTWGLVDEPACVIRLLKAQFAGLFARENLTPLPGSDLVRDRHYAIAFHSQLALQEDAAQRDALYAEDLSKLTYLAEKTQAQLRAAKTIWVYKSQRPVNLGQILALHGAMAAYGPNRLLVVEADPSRPAGVEILDQGLYLGHLPAYSPGDKAWYFDPEAWNILLRATLRMAGRTAGP